VDKEENHQNGRYPFLEFRQRVWKEIVAFVIKDAGEVTALLELGAGYCDFINQFPAKRKIAYDLNPEMLKFAGPDVDLRIEDAAHLRGLEENTMEMVFASNFLEHLDQGKLGTLLSRIRDVLTQKGKFIILQPNYRLCAERYFEDPTHRTVFSDENISGFLEPFGFKVIKLVPGLLPFSMQSRLPKWPFLVKLYLMSPLKPMAAQMYVVAEKELNHLER
jgi:SAM-dependent methyltransferase